MAVVFPLHKAVFMVTIQTYLGKSLESSLIPEQPAFAPFTLLFFFSM